MPPPLRECGALHLDAPDETAVGGHLDWWNHLVGGEPVSPACWIGVCFVSLTRLKATYTLPVIASECAPFGKAISTRGDDCAGATTGTRIANAIPVSQRRKQ